MAYAEGQLSGSADFRVGINIWRSSTTNEGNYSTYGYEVHLTTPQQYGTWDGESTQSWSANIGGQVRSGTFKLEYDNRYTEDVIVGSGYVGVAHNADGTRPSFASTASISTNHSSVGSGTSAKAYIDAPRIPKAPTTVRNVRVTDTKPGALTLAWDAPSDSRGSAITAYKVRYSPTSPSDAAPYTDVDLGASARSATISGLTPGTTYWITVYARNGATYDNSGYSPKTADISQKTTSGAYVWNGSAWKAAEVYVWSGTAWRPGEVKTFNSTWKDAA